MGRFLSLDPLAASGDQDRFSPYAAMGDEPAGLVDPGGMRFQSRDIIPFAPPPNFGGFLPSSLAFMGIGPNGIDLDGSGQDMDEDWDIGANGEISGTFSDDMADMFSQTYGGGDGDRDAHGTNENFNGKWYKGDKGDGDDSPDGNKHLNDHKIYDSDDRNPAQDKKLTPDDIKRLKEYGWDHSDKGKHGGQTDLYRDPKSGEIYQKPRGGRGYGEPIGINWNDVTRKTVEVGVGVGMGIIIIDAVSTYWPVMLLAL